MLQNALQSLMAGEPAQVLCGICDSGAPAVMETNSCVFSGALFFMIEMFPRNPEIVYGELKMDDNLEIFFNDERRENLFDLASRL